MGMRECGAMAMLVMEEGRWSTQPGQDARGVVPGASAQGPRLTATNQERLVARSDEDIHKTPCARSKGVDASAGR